MLALWDGLEPRAGRAMRAGHDRVPLLLRLAVRLLPPAVREEVLGDLLEHRRGTVRAALDHARPLAVAHLLRVS
jgi:hypothetical protein